MQNKKRIFLPAMLLTGFIGSSAWATPISFEGQFSVSTGLLVTPTEFFGNPTGHYTDFMLLNLPSFDSTLGTLNNVSISIASTFTSNMEGFASDSTDLCMFIGCEMRTIEASIAVDHHLTLTGHLLNAPSTTVVRTDYQGQECSYVVTGPTGVSCNANEMPPHTGFFNDTFDLSDYSLADFIDVSNLFFAFQLESDLSGFCGLELRSERQECLVNRIADWNGTVNVTYDYTDGSGGDGGSGGGGAHAVPEPGTTSLFAAGLIALALVRRRKSVLARAGRNGNPE